MQKLHFSITIDAPKEKVWNTMIEDETYRQWTDVFNPLGCYYEGSWEEGSKMLFLGPDAQGKIGGMISRIKENRPYEYISIEHIGLVKDGKEDTTSEEVKKWVPAFENYTLKDSDGMTEVLVDLDSNDEYAEMFEGMWPKALQRLKEICEK